MSPSVSVRLLLTQSDQRLVELARAGHERAFEALVQRYRRPLLGYCRRLLLPNERAEDALQQGLLQAWLALQGGTEVREVKPWLYRVVHNAALNMLRRSGYDWAELNEALSGGGAPTEDLDRRIAVRETLAGMAALPELQREALLRTAVDGSSYQQTAATMGLSEPAVRGLVHRARSTLRAAATALTPSPLLTWALSAGGGDAPLAGRLVEAGASGGSIGLAGILAKAGATALTAGVLVGGIGTLHHQHHHGAAGRRAGSPRNVARPTVGPSEAKRELALSQTPMGTGAAPVTAHLAPHDPTAFTVHSTHRAGRRGLDRHRRGPGHPTVSPISAAPPPAPASHSTPVLNRSPVVTHRADHTNGSGEDGEHSHNGAHQESRSSSDGSHSPGGEHETSTEPPDNQQPPSGPSSSGEGDSSGGSHDSGSHEEHGESPSSGTDVTSESGATNDTETHRSGSD